MAAPARRGDSASAVIVEFAVDKIQHNFSRQLVARAHVDNALRGGLDPQGLGFLRRNSKRHDGGLPVCHAQKNLKLADS